MVTKKKVSPKKAQTKKTAKAPAAKSVKVHTAAKPAKAVKKAAQTPKKTVLSPREKKLLSIKERLLRQKAMLLGEAESAINALPDQTAFPDMGDQATVETDRYFMLRLRGREKRLLDKIEEAVERMDRGVYGVCDICGQEIHIHRLEARPVTCLCIDCKTEQEEEEKLSGS